MVCVAWAPRKSQLRLSPFPSAVATFVHVTFVSESATRCSLEAWTSVVDAAMSHDAWDTRPLRDILTPPLKHYDVSPDHTV